GRRVVMEGLQRVANLGLDTTRPRAVREKRPELPVVQAPLPEPDDGLDEVRDHRRVPGVLRHGVGTGSRIGSRFGSGLRSGKGLGRAGTDGALTGVRSGSTVIRREGPGSEAQGDGMAGDVTIVTSRLRSVCPVDGGIARR